MGKRKDLGTSSVKNKDFVIEFESILDFVIIRTQFNIIKMVMPHKHNQSNRLFSFVFWMTKGREMT